MEWTVAVRLYLQRKWTFYPKIVKTGKWEAGGDESYVPHKNGPALLQETPPSAYLSGRVHCSLLPCPTVDLLPNWLSRGDCIIPCRWGFPALLLNDKTPNLVSCNSLNIGFFSFYSYFHCFLSHLFLHLVSVTTLFFCFIFFVLNWFACNWIKATGI